MFLNVFDICRQGTHVLGPGNRYVIWVQGCKQNCPGCLTPESRPIMENTLIDVDDLVADIVLAKNIDGLTISGGEPFLQANALTYLLDKVKRVRPELTVIVYTGYGYRTMMRNPVCRKLIDSVDVVIDGKYIDKLNDNKGIRGSSNQNINFVTSRLSEYAEIMESGRRKLMKVIEFSGTVTTIGIPNFKSNRLDNKDYE